MKSPDEFDFMDGLPEPRLEMPAAERAGLLRLGLNPADVDALERAVALVRENDANDGRRKRAKVTFTDAMLHYRRHGAEILDGLAVTLRQILGQDHPTRAGADILFGKTRGDVRGFRITNSLRAFYMRILAAKRPEAVHRLDFGSSWADMLIRAEWPPVTSGKEDDDEPDDDEPLAPSAR